MRAVYALACTLGTTVAALSVGLTGQEFSRWVLWMQAEQVGPEWQALRHADLMAATHNGGQFKRHGGGPFKAADFLRADPWHDAPSLTPEQEAARMQREYDEMLRAAEGQA